MPVVVKLCVPYFIGDLLVPKGLLYRNAECLKLQINRMRVHKTQGAIQAQISQAVGVLE